MYPALQNITSCSAIQILLWQKADIFNLHQGPRSGAPFSFPGMSIGLCSAGEGIKDPLLQLPGSLVAIMPTEQMVYSLVFCIIYSVMFNVLLILVFLDTRNGKETGHNALLSSIRNLSWWQILSPQIFKHICTNIRARNLLFGFYKKKKKKAKAHVLRKLYDVPNTIFCTLLLQNYNIHIPNKSFLQCKLYIAYIIMWFTVQA